METKRTTVIVFPPGGKAYETTIEGDTLPGLQALVSGYIELVRLSADVDIWCDEEFLLKGAAPNRLVGRTVIHGPFVLARHDNEGNTIGVLTGDMAKYGDAFPLYLGTIGGKP